MTCGEVTWLARAGFAFLSGFHGDGDAALGAGQGGGAVEHRQLRVHLGGGRRVRPFAAEELAAGAAAHGAAEAAAHLLQRDDVPDAEPQRGAEQVDRLLHQRRQPARAAAVHVPAEHGLLVRPGRPRRAVQPLHIRRHHGAPRRGVPADSDHHAGPRHVAAPVVDDARNGARGGRPLVRRRHQLRGGQQPGRQSVHQLLVAHPSRRGLSLLLEGHHETSQQSAGAKLSAQFDEAAALPPGAVGLLLEDLRLQQEVLVLRAQEQRRAGRAGADFVPLERFAGRPM